MNRELTKREKTLLLILVVLVLVLGYCKLFLEPIDRQITSFRTNTDIEQAELDTDRVRLAQLEQIRRGEIEDWEMEGDRRTVIGGYRATLDDQGRQEEFWLGQSAAGLEEDIPALCAQLETVTKEQVAQAAQKLQLDTIYFLKGKEGQHE